MPLRTSLYLGDSDYPGHRITPQQLRATSWGPQDRASLVMGKPRNAGYSCVGLRSQYRATAAIVWAARGRRTSFQPLASLAARIGCGKWFVRDRIHNLIYKNGPRAGFVHPSFRAHSSGTLVRVAVALGRKAATARLPGVCLPSCHSSSIPTLASCCGTSGTPNMTLPPRCGRSVVIKELGPFPKQEPMGWKLGDVSKGPRKSK